MGKLISELESITGRKCFDTYRRCLDRERNELVEYDSFEHQFMREQGETQRINGPRDIKGIAIEWLKREPAIKFFMDGSRRTYKIADLQISSQVFPIIAGQVGVAVCRRDNKHLSPCETMMHVVVAFPNKLDSEGKGWKQEKAFFANLANQLNARQDRIKIDAVLSYSTMANENFEDKGIARIQDYMIEREKEMVQRLVKENLITQYYVIKDGSLEYNKISNKNDPFTFNRIRSNYRRVIGVSKSFNPELAKLKNNRSAAGLIANLKPFERTPAAMYQTDRVDGKFAVWYVRLRNARKTRGPFDGIVKVEKILVSEQEEEYGLETREVDNISAWLMNERNPVCYGKDDRWANHLYPIYLTESYIKSQYMGTLRFINSF